jgi:hypothetical protein
VECVVAFCEEQFESRARSFVSDIGAGTF